MQDNEKIVITGLTDKEYEFIENIRKENAERLSKMSKEELLEYIKTLCPEQELNFEKQIKGTTYKVNTSLMRILNIPYYKFFLKY